MPSFISGSCYIQAAIHRLCFGLIIVGMNFATCAAQIEDDFFLPKHNPLTTNLVYSDTGLSPYRLSASLMLTRPANTVLGKAEFSSLPRLFPADDTKKETVFSPFMRVELKGEQLKIILRPHSAWIRWHKEFH